MSERTKQNKVQILPEQVSWKKRLTDIQRGNRRFQLPKHRRGTNILRFESRTFQGGQKVLRLFEYQHWTQRSDGGKRQKSQGDKRRVSDEEIRKREVFLQAAQSLWRHDNIKAVVTVKWIKSDISESDGAFLFGVGDFAGGILGPRKQLPAITNQRIPQRDDSNLKHLLAVRPPLPNLQHRHLEVLPATVPRAIASGPKRFSASDIVIFDKNPTIFFGWIPAKIPDSNAKAPQQPNRLPTWFRSLLHTNQLRKDHSDGFCLKLQEQHCQQWGGFLTQQLWQFPTTHYRLWNRIQLPVHPQ